jgi:hypothetical protein
MSSIGQHAVPQRQEAASRGHNHDSQRFLLPHQFSRFWKAPLDGDRLVPTLPLDILNIAAPDGNERTIACHRVQNYFLALMRGQTASDK